MESKDLKWVYDTLLLSPGMETGIKIDLKVSRKVALFLVTVFDRGLQKGHVDENDLISLSAAVPQEALEEIKQTILEKAGISDMYDKLQELV